MSLHLGVDKGSQDVGGDWQVGEDELRLLVEAEQRKIVPQLHDLYGSLLLEIESKDENRKTHEHPLSTFPFVSQRIGRTSLT